MIQEPLRNFSGRCLLSLIPFNHIAKLNATVAAPCGTCPAMHATQRLGNYLLHHTYLPAQPRLMWQHPCQLIETMLITRNNSNKLQKRTSIKGTPIRTINQQKINNEKVTISSCSDRCNFPGDFALFSHHSSHLEAHTSKTCTAIPDSQVTRYPARSAAYKPTCLAAGPFPTQTVFEAHRSYLASWVEISAWIPRGISRNTSHVRNAATSPSRDIVLLSLTQL